MSDDDPQLSKALREARKSATSPKETVRTLPSLKELSDNTMGWTNEQLKEYDDMLDNYRMSVWRIYRLRIELEKEEEEIGE